MDKSKLFFEALVLVFIFSFSFVSAETNITSQKDAELCLNQSQNSINLLLDSGFSFQRVNDTLNEAKLLYLSQINLPAYNKNKNFSKVIKYCNEIINLKEQAFTARDELQALLKFYNSTITSGMNTSSIDLFISKINNEIASERYENVKLLVDSTYNEISFIQSEYSALNVFYMNTTKSLKIFFKKNGLSLSFILILLIIFFASYQIKIRKWIIQNKIGALETRKATIKSLIMDLQRGYFHQSNISEAEYNVKTKKFGELIRDIDRQIPLLKEQLAKMESKFIKSKGVK